MDSDKANPGNGLEVAHQNGMHKQLPDAGENGNTFDNTNGIAERPTESDISALVGNLEDATLEDPVTEDNSSFELPKEVEESNDEHPKPSKPQKDRNLEKLSKPKVVSTTGPKKNKDVKDSERAAKPAVGSVRSTKQPTKSRSFNDRQSQPKRDGKSDPANSEGVGDQTKLKPLKKGLPIKQEAEAEPSPSPKAEDTKPRKTGALPNYGFSFRCDERAEKRREFYTKLEEKIQAKEVEKTTLQEKSKETQEAEIRMFRKSLTFKATPMPTFYQEPAPPKAELKKIPPTRAKSPKLGRRKSSIGGESSEENTTTPSHQGRRLSLDVVPRARVTPSASSSKPHRRSLPNSSSSKIASSSKRSNDDEEGEETTEADVAATSANQELDAVPTLEVNEAHETVAVEH